MGWNFKHTPYIYWGYQKQSKWPESPCRDSGSMIGECNPVSWLHLRRRWFISPYTFRSQFLTEGSWVGTWRRELKQAPRREACSAHFLISPGLSLQGPHYSRWTGSSHIMFKIEKMPHDIARGHSLDSKPQLRTPPSRWFSLCHKLTKQRTLLKHIKLLLYHWLPEAVAVPS